MRRWLLLSVAATALAGCGSTGSTSGTSAAIRTLEREARPIGRAARFHAPAVGPVLGACRAQLGDRNAAHVELFAQNRVVLLASGIGVRRPRQEIGGRITRADCYGGLATIDPTGVVLTRVGSSYTLAGLFRSWGQPLSRTDLAGFPASRSEGVRVYLNGHRLQGVDPRTVRLTRHAEVVLEVGPNVEPHRSYTFPPGQ